jgi:hypothetical protein
VGPVPVHLPGRYRRQPEGHVQRGQVIRVPANRWDTIDEVKAGEDRRHNCYTLTFDGPTDMECDEVNRTGDFFSDEGQETGVKFARLSMEVVRREDGETVRRFVYRYPRFQRAGFYDLYLHCRTPKAP